MAPGEIFLAQFPFGAVPGMKLRPVLALTGNLGPIPEILVAYISSVVPGQLLPSDILMSPSTAQFHATGLKVASVLRLHKLATIHRVSLVRRLGQLDPATAATVAEKLRALLKVWASSSPQEPQHG